MMELPLFPAGPHDVRMRAAVNQFVEHLRAGRAEEATRLLAMVSRSEEFIQFYERLNIPLGEKRRALSGALFQLFSPVRVPLMPALSLCETDPSPRVPARAGRLRHLRHSRLDA